MAQELSERTGSVLQDMISESSAMLEKPAPKIVPKPKPKTQVSNSDGTPPLGGGIRMVVSARAYCLRGKTASGRYTRHGIIAVDPRVIPMGSKLFVPGYGWGIAADTGGMILGRTIDLWMPSASQCYQWGKRNVRITVYPRR